MGLLAFLSTLLTKDGFKMLLCLELEGPNSSLQRKTQEAILVTSETEYGGFAIFLQLLKANLHWKAGC